MTLAYFPEPRPDELLYSLLARWRHHVGLPASTNATKALFGRDARHKTPFDLPIQLEALAEHLPEAQGLTVDRLIDDHTLYPYLTAFLPKERAARVRQAMREPGGTPYNHLGLRMPGRDYVMRLRYCPNCVQDMTASFGEPYWKRSHQLPSSLVCDVHGDVLAESDIEFSKYRNGYEAAAFHCTGNRAAWRLPAGWLPALTSAAKAGAALLASNEAALAQMEEAMCAKRIAPASFASLTASPPSGDFLTETLFDELLRKISENSDSASKPPAIAALLFGVLRFQDEKSHPETCF